MGTAGRAGPSWESRTMRETDGRTDGRMNGRANGRTDGRTSVTEIRSGTVGGPSRLASIHSPPNSLDLGISSSSRTLSLRLVVPALLCHVFHLPRASSIHLASPSRFSQLLSRVSSSLFRSQPFPPTILLAAFFSPHLRRILFSSSFSRCDPPSPPRRPNIPPHRPSSRCRTGTRNSSSLPTHDSTTLDYASSRCSIQPRHYHGRCLCIRVRNSFVPVSFGLYEL